MIKTVEVVAAIIYNASEILCVQRPKSTLPYISEKFEFPGGKIESNESHEEALKRELKEELDISVTIEKFFLTVEHNYPDFKLIMHSYLVKMVNRKISLNEHISHLWLPINELNEPDWAAADLPIVKKLVDNGE